MARSSCFSIKAESMATSLLPVGRFQHSPMLSPEKFNRSAGRQLRRHLQDLRLLGTRELTANAGTITTGCHAIIHLAECGAVLGAGFAQLGAQGGEAGVKLALASQRVGGEGAKSGAVQHQAQ